MPEVKLGIEESSPGFPHLEYCGRDSDSGLAILVCEQFKVFTAVSRISVAFTASKNGPRLTAFAKSRDAEGSDALALLDVRHTHFGTS